MDHITYRDYIENRRSFIYCSLATVYYHCSLTGDVRKRMGEHLVTACERRVTAAPSPSRLRSDTEGWSELARRSVCAEQV